MATRNMEYAEEFCKTEHPDTLSQIWSFHTVGMVYAADMRWQEPVDCMEAIEWFCERLGVEFTEEAACWPVTNGRRGA